MLKTTVVFAMLLAVSFVGAGMTVDVPSELDAKPWYEVELLAGAPATGPYPMGLAHLTHGNDWTIDQPPEGQSALERAEWIMNERPAQGMTPQAWIDWATGLNAVAPGVLPEASLDDSVARLYAAMGLPFTASDLLHVQTQADALPAEIEKPFAGVVEVIAAAYEEQMLVAADISLRFPTFDPHVPLMTEAQRDATSARADTILAAVAAFREATAHVWDQLPALSNDDPLFVDGNGLIFLGGPGDGSYAPEDSTLRDAVLIIEPSGNDLYTNSAGGACPDAASVLVKCNLLALSVLADFDGDDRYIYDGAPAVVQGAGAMGGLGILADAQGNDVYDTTMTRTTNGPNLGVQYYFDGGGQGYGYFGQGYLLDGLGDDVWEFNVDSTFNRHIWLLGQGFGGGGGVGVALDGDGNDVWDTQAILDPSVDGSGNGFQGVYSMGTGFYGGVGFMGDLGLDDDVYVSYAYAETVDYYAQGFGAFGGVGIMYEDGGNDDYFAGEHGRNPWISPLLNCAYGTGSYGGIGIMVDVAGNDRYYGETVNDRRGATIDNEGAGHPAPAYGLFMDTGGDDEHLMYVFAPAGQETHIGGRGVVENDNLVGTYVDIGGTDTYVGPGGDGEVWALGADINTV